MDIKTYENFHLEEIKKMYQSVGWTNYLERIDILEEAYANSICVLGAYDDDRMIGIIRAVGDGKTIIFVQDIIVLPEYQRKGIGTKLLKAVVEKYNDDQIEIGFSVVPLWQGRGLATEALEKVLEYLTENEGIPCVTAWCAAENVGSRRVLEKAGMRLLSEEKGGLEVGGRVYDKLVYEHRS